jgi:signal transduction histidine kinase/tetratricopeptide (TPR) repeat protein
MNKLKLFFISIVFIANLPVFSQEKISKDLIRIEINKKAKEFKKEIYFNKASSFYLNKNWDSTLVYSMKQLALKDNKNELIDYCHYFRAYSFLEKKLLNESKNEFNTISNKFRFHYKVKMNLGKILLEQKEYQKAIKCYKELEKLSDNESYGFKKSILYQNLGSCYLILNQFDLAEKYLFKSSKLQEKEKDTLLIISSYLVIANLYYLQYKDTQAIPYFEKAYLLSKKIKDFEIKKTTAMNMSVVAENRKNFPLALVYRKEYETWKDSLNDQNKVWAIADLEKKFTVKQKDKEIKVLVTENKLKIAERNGLFYSSVLLLVLFGSGVYFYRQKIKHNKIVLSQKEELDELNATKDKLFSIVSHDLRSSVSALKTSNAKLIDNLKSKNFVELDKLLNNNSAIANSTYNLLDNLLNWALLQTKQIFFKKASLHLFSVINQIEYNYKPLMLNKNISFENTVSKNVFVFADLDSLKIIIRNLLDNAIKFSKENGSILIYNRIGNDANFCEFVIEDSGQGMDENTKRDLLKETILLSKKKTNEDVGTGLGMQLCKMMIKKNGGKLDIESQENIGTKIIITIPKSEKNG